MFQLNIFMFYGGTMGLFLGISILSFIEFAELALNILLIKMNRKVTSPMADSDQSDIREEMTVESLKNN